jgi:hypothetical protein
VLHRLFASGSDRAAERWREDYLIPGTEALDLHHLYRAMAFLGQEIESKGQKTLGTPRRLKDLIEEELFERRRDLFTEVDLGLFRHHLTLLWLNSNKGTNALTGFFATFYARRTFGNSAPPKIGSSLVDQF